MTFGRSLKTSLVMAILILGSGKPLWAQATVCFLPHCLAGATLQPSTVARSTGNPALDSKLRAEARLLAQTFGVDPQIFLFDDRRWPNAYASPRTHPPYRDTVFMGHQLVSQTAALEPVGQVAVVLVMAHEWAHILQGSAGLPSGFSLRHRELHADVLAGWYLGRRHLGPSTQVTSVAFKTFGRPPQAMYSTVTHGAPDARMAAMMLGYARYDWPLDRIYRFGLQFLVRHF